MIEDIITQSDSFKKISSEIASGRLSHAILLISQDGEYLKAFATLIAKAVLCPNFSVTGHSNCTVCDNVAKGVHPDIHLFGVSSVINADDTSKIINEIYLRPYSADKKVYILADYDNIGEVAENKLLKTIEEPPQDTIFILLAKNTNKLLQTTLSRTQKFYLSSFTVQELTEILKSRLVKSPEYVAALANGNLEIALKIGAEDDAAKMCKFAVDTLCNMNQTYDVLAYATKMEKFGKDLAFLIDYFLMLVRDVMCYKSGAKDIITNKVIESDIKQIAAQYSYLALTSIVDAGLLASKMLEANVSKQNVIDQFLLKVLEVKLKCKR